MQCNTFASQCNKPFYFSAFFKYRLNPLFIGSSILFQGQRNLHTSFCAPYVLDEGNIVQMGDLGNFRMSLKTATATATEKEFKASCIEKGKVLFYPGSDLRKLCKTLDFALYKSDGKPDSGDEPLPDDGKGDQPGGGSGDDGDEAPDPTV